MTFNAHEYSIDQLELIGDQTQKYLFQLWQKNNLLDDWLLHLGEDLVILGAPRGDVLPPLLHVGEKSLAAKVLGDGWRKDVLQHRGVEHITQSYENAYDGEPIYEYINFQSERVDFGYERLILRFKTNKGFPLLITYATIAYAKLRPDHPANPQSATLEDFPSNNLVLFGKGELPNSQRLKFG